MTKTLKIYAGAPVRQLLRNHGLTRNPLIEDTPTAAINRVVDRYHAIVERSLPVLTTSQWGVVFDALDGVWEEIDPSMYVDKLDQAVADAIERAGLDRKWTVDAEDLVARLQFLSFAEKLAIIEMAERWAGRPISKDETLAEAIADLVGNQGIRRPVAS